MKYIFTLLIITTSVLIAQGRSITYDELMKQYPQLSSSVAKKTTSQQNLPKQNSLIDFNFSDYTDTELLMLDSLGVLEILLDTTEIDKGPIHFGYKFFNNKNKFAIYDNIPIPANYRLGPGDQLIISIWGATQFRSRHLINREGDIFINDIGQVNLSGMDISTAESFIKEKYGQNTLTCELNARR